MTYTEQLERDTEQTRLKLADTIEELRDRFTPGQVLDEALDYASDGDVGDYLRSFKRQIMDNPVPLGLIGASMAWLIVGSAFSHRRNGRVPREHGERKADDRAAGARAQGADFAAAARTASAEIVDSARMAAHDLGDRAAKLRTDATKRVAEVPQDVGAAAARMGDHLYDAATTVGAHLAAAKDGLADSASRSAEAIAGVASEIGRDSRAASRALFDFAHEQPLILAAAGAVLGAILGALLPSTETEDRLIGNSSDATKEKLREAAAEQYTKAKDLAVQTAETALGESGTVASSSDDSGGRHSASEFGPGPGDHARAEPASADHADRTVDAEPTHAGGT
jgi:ElaB/YqjD/DUF883 family membrane-anchored ribosome-binding protein